MEPESPREPPPQEGSCPPGERPPSALGQSLSQIVHRLTSQEPRRGKARSAALEDLSALIEATECDELLEGGGTWRRGMPEVLGQVARALEKYAAPPREQEGRRRADCEVAEKAAAVGLLFLKVLGRMEAAKSSLVGPTWTAGLRHSAAPIYVFALTHSLEHPWTSPGSREVAGEVLSVLLRVTPCASVAGFLHGEHEDEKGRFTAVMEPLKRDLNK